MQIKPFTGVRAFGVFFIRRSLVGVICMLAIAPAAASPRFPEEMQGTWDLGPVECRLPVSPDADSPIHIKRDQLEGYENIDIPKRIKRVSKVPLAWTVTTTTNIAPGILVSDLYILKGDYLTISDGERTRLYRRCR